MYIYKTGNYMVSIDWLQAYCHGCIVEAGEYPSSIGTITAVLEDGGTANFLRRMTLSCRGVEIATLLQSPKYSIFDRRMTELKLHNRVLYTSVPVKILLDICKALKLEYKGISRIDLCCDCNTLSGGRSVEELISSFVHLRAGEVGHIIRKGSARYNLHGNNHRKAAIRHESIKFGSVTSSCVPYIYNKSLELISVKDKPWIREAWKHAGLVHIIDKEGLQRLSSKELAAKLDDEGVSEFIRSGVWRFEISIKGRGKDLLNVQDGELFKLSLDSISTASKIEELFMTYAAKYFCFRVCDRGQQRIRDYSPVVLWDYDNHSSYRPYSFSVEGSTGKFDQSVVNYLNKTMRTYSDIASPVLCGLMEAKDFIQSIAGAKMYLLRKKRYEDYLCQMQCTEFYNSLEDEVMKAIVDVSSLRDEYREYLNSIHSEQSS